MATSVPTHAYPQVRHVRPRSEAALIRGALDGPEADLEPLFRARWPRAYRSTFRVSEVLEQRVVAAACGPWSTRRAVGTGMAAPTFKRVWA